MQKLMTDLNMKKYSCSGCQVDLRSRINGLLMCKALGVAPTNHDFAQHMHLKCQSNHPYTDCILHSGNAGMAAYYTPVG